MQRNPSKTPADLALSSRFICLKPPSPCTHVANLLSVGFFIYLETADQILSQCTLSQLHWLLAHGFIPAEGTCSLLAGVCGCRINWGVYLGVCSKRSQTDQTIHVTAFSVAVCKSGEPRCHCLPTSPDSPGKNSLFCQEENILKSSTRFATTREGDSWRSLTWGRQCCCCVGFASCDKKQTELQRESFCFICRS